MNRREFLAAMGRVGALAVLPVQVVGQRHVLPASELPTVTQDIYRPGWIPCDGRKLPKEYFKELYKVVGGVYGENDTSFCVPDLRGKHIERNTKATPNSQIMWYINSHGYEVPLSKFDRDNVINIAAGQVEAFHVRMDK